MNNKQRGYRMHMEQTSMTNRITSPPHYVGERSVEPLDVIEAWNLNYHLGNILKYISRAGRKDCEQMDLEKALFYLDRALRNCPSVKAESYVKKEIFTVEKVAKDWRLNTSLEIALMHLHLATVSTPTFHIESVQKQVNIRLKQLKIIEKKNKANENSQSLVRGIKK